MAMDRTELFDQLEEILKELSIEIKYGRGYFDGGICRYKGNQEAHAEFDLQIQAAYVDCFATLIRIGRHFLSIG